MPGDNGKSRYNSAFVGPCSRTVTGHADQPQEERPIFGHSSNPVRYVVSLRSLGVNLSHASLLTDKLQDHVLNIQYYSCCQ